MAIQFTNLILIIIYILIVLVIGYLSSRKETKEGFLISSRKLGAIALTCTVAATLIGGNAIVTYGSFFYRYGLSISAALIGFVIGLVLIIILGKKMKKISDAKKFHTLSDYFYDRYGKRTGQIVTIIIIFWFMMILLIQFIAGGKLISAVTEISYAISVLIMGLIVFIYLTLGGFKAVVKTDVFQFLLLAVLAIFVAVSLIHSGAITKDVIFGEKLNIGVSIAFIIIGAAVMLVGADMWQRVYAAKNTKTVAIGFGLAAVLVVIALLAIATIVLAVKSQFPGTRPEDSIIVGFTKLFPPWLEGIGFILLFAVIMSTIDTLLFVLATNFSKDFWIRNVNENINIVKYTRIGALVFGFLAMILAIFVQDIVRIGLAYASIGLVFAPALVASFYWKLKPRAIILSLVTGVIGVIIFFGLGYVGPETSVISLPVALIFLLIGQKVYRK